MNFELVNVGIGEIGVLTAPNILRTILGSCVGICLYDNEMKIGGLAHIMLPTNKLNTPSTKKYADSAIPFLIEEMEKSGGNRENFTAKIVGGATMFKFSENSIMGEIGNNNVKKVKEVLDSVNIKIIAEDTGGDYGRTIDFYIDTGEVKIKSIGKDEKVL